jgi:signal transduction histidine kinase
MTTINLRSTATLTNYVRTVDRMRTLAKQLAELSKLEAKLRPEVLSEIGERREIAVRGQVRILEPQAKESIGQLDTEMTVERFKAIGLPVNVRSAEWVAPASFSKLVEEGAVPDDLIKRTSETIVIVH